MISSRMKTLLLFCSVLLVCLLLAEIVLRFFVQSHYGIPPGAFIADDELDFRPQPGFTGVFINPEHPLRDIPLTINSYGFRGPEYSVEKGSGVKRVVLLGDSMTMAEQVLYEETHGSLLQEKLRSSSSSMWEVLNLGVSGYGTRHALGFYHRIGQQFDPDIVIYAFTHNDLGDNLGSTYTVVGNERLSYLYINASREWVLFKSWLYRHSALLRIMYRATTLHDTSVVSLSSSEEQWDIFRLYVRDLRRSVAPAQLIVLYNKPLIDDDSDLLRLHEVLTSEEIPLVVPESSVKHYFPIDSHWNIAGHELVAETLFRVIVSRE